VISIPVLHNFEIQDDSSPGIAEKVSILHGEETPAYKNTIFNDADWCKLYWYYASDFNQLNTMIMKMLFYSWFLEFFPQDFSSLRTAVTSTASITGGINGVLSLFTSSTANVWVSGETLYHVQLVSSEV